MKKICMKGIVIDMTNEAIAYAEKIGIYEIWKQRGNVITYYSWYPDNLKHPILKVTRNLKTGKETRKHLRYKKVPKFLVTPEGTLYNYCCG